MKICIVCKIEKSLNEFYNNGLEKGTACKDCVKKIQTKYNNKNREKINANCRRYFAENKDVILAKAKLYYAKNKEKIAARNKAWKDKSKDKINEAKRKWRKKRRESDSLYKLEDNLRRRINKAFESKSWKKGQRTEKLLGSDYITVKSHIERQFKKGMSWENHGHSLECWHIDHVIPLSSAKTEEELVNLCHYTNLQPLWANENLKKSNKINKPIQIKMTI